MRVQRILPCAALAVSLLATQIAMADDGAASGATGTRVVAGGKVPSDLPAESSSLDITDRMADLLSTAKANGQVMRLYSAWERGDKKALGQIFDAARNGNAWAQELGGYMLDNGEGVPQNSRLAADYFAHAANDVPLARYNLGLLYYYGRGVPKDQAKAADLFKRSAVNGGADQACVLLSLYYLNQKDMDDAYKWANEGANRGNVKSFYLLGRILFQRGQYKEARLWTEKAAAAVEPNAPAILAEMYAEGKGIDRNPTMAAGWWLIYSGLNHRGSNISALSSFNLTQDQQQRATAFANSWLANHRAERHVEYRKTILQAT